MRCDRMRAGRVQVYGAWDMLAPFSLPGGEQFRWPGWVGVGTQVQEDFDSYSQGMNHELLGKALGHCKLSDQFEARSRFQNSRRRTLAGQSYFQAEFRNRVCKTYAGHFSSRPESGEFLTDSCRLETSWITNQ